MPQISSRSLLAFGLAGLIGLVAGYADEALARDGIAFSGESYEPAPNVDRRFDRNRESERARSMRRERENFDAGDAVSDRGFDERRIERGRDRGFRVLGKPDIAYDFDGSFIVVHDAARSGLARNRAFDGIAIGGINEGDGDAGYSTFYRDDRTSGDGDAPAFPSGARIIDIDRERLDRRPIGPSGIEIIQNGGPKIIRIAPGYRRDTNREAALADTPRPSATSQFQPWSSGWLKQCSKAYGTFDPELGTYVARDGRVRFCQID